MAITEISVDELAAVLEAGANLVDVRENDEYVEAHVPGAVHVPLATVPDNLDAFAGEHTYVICKGGGRSMRACEYLEAHGVITVNVAGGTMAWQLSGRPTVAGTQPS
jgi:rhodanese-related sulfurtransferase